LLLRSIRFLSALMFSFIFLGFVHSVSAQTIVLYASQAPVKVGNWTTVADSTAAGSYRLANPDKGADKIVTASATPASYVELSFYAYAGQPYHLWMRGKADADSPYNDSVHIQFSGSVTSTGSAIYRIGTTSSTEYNLEDCFGCGIQGWGWQDNGWGVMGPDIYFQTTGTQTIRIQPREDGLSIDQIVLSPSAYLFTSPGALKNDSVILTQNSGAPAPTPTPVPSPSPTPTPSPSSASEIVIWASNVPSSSVFGAWRKESNSTAAGQIALHQPDLGAAKIVTAAANPTDYFEVTFNAQSGTAYRLWIRGRADGDYWSNDSVFAQFSGSVNSTGSAAYRIGTSDALVVNLEDCSGCGLQGWGWQDDGWGSGVLGPLLYFQSTGTQRLRVQTREDGFSIDQIVLSPLQYLMNSPGLLKNDTVILPSTLGAPAPSPTPTPTPNQPPQLSISASPTSGVSPLFVSFSSTASDPDGYIASYYWNFGDNTTSTLPNPTHMYAAGSYLASLSVTDNNGAVTTQSVQINVTVAVTSTIQLKVMSWNVDFGEGTDEVTDWNRTTTWIANINPDLVALCEMPPASIGTVVNLLSQKTGRTWYWYFAPKFDGCPEGNLILSKYSFVSTSLFYLSYQRSVAQATVNVNGSNVNFFATHLDAYDSSYRYQEITELQNFASRFAEPRIVCGDFNAGPDTTEASHMSELYYDSWLEAMNVGTAVAYPDNPVNLQTRTRRGRLDYVWTSRAAGNLVIKSAQIPDERDLNNPNVLYLIGTLDDKGVRPSDHNLMTAIVEIH
jgi:endonuclease/exonuclease/phosphatase family metal-dependent hydrolase